MQRVLKRFENRSKGFLVHCSIPEQSPFSLKCQRIDKGIILCIYVFIFHPFSTIFRRDFCFRVKCAKQNSFSHSQTSHFSCFVTFPRYFKKKKQTNGMSYHLKLKTETIVSKHFLTFQKMYRWEKLKRYQK